MLLINDHILKATHPSWLTGKLSDFAGLFFFPFIVAMVLSVALSRTRLSIRRIGAIAFGTVAAWFILLKTVPAMNGFSAAMASFFLGFPTSYALDPTDLISLASIFPAWLIWQQPRPVTNYRSAYAVLLAGSIALIATSPPQYTISEVTNLEYYRDGIVFAADAKTMGSENSYPVAKSPDGGLTWEQTFEINNIEEKNPPIKHCSHLHPGICYRLDASGILKQLNFEEKWVEVQGFIIDTDNGPWYPIAYDLILFEWEETEYVMVAIGRFGIMRRELPNGAWIKIPVLYAGD